MNSRSRIHSASSSAVAFTFLLLAAPLAFAESDSLATMARIVTKLNHFPSAQEKEILSAISENESSSAATRVIADAIHDLEHQVKPDDAAELKEIAADTSATEVEKQLAEIVLGIDHKAAPEAVQALEKLTQK